MKGPVYWHPVLYRLAMQGLYGKYFEERYRSVAAWIPDGASLTEVCAGDAYLYSHYLQKKNIRYTGLDNNPSFLLRAKKKNLPVAQHDLVVDAVPPGEVILIQAGLYQFMPGHHTVIRKLLDAAAKTLIIAEPVRNLSHHRNPFISFLAKRISDPGSGRADDRFTKASLLECFGRYSEFSEWKETAGGREVIGIFRK